MTTQPPHASGANGAAIDLQHVTIAYHRRVVCDDISLSVAAGSFTVLVGANGCGKSTLLKAVAGTVPVAAGTVTVEGRPRRAWGRRELARRVGLLPQSNVAPEGILVRDLVARGRHPYRSALQRWSRADDSAVDEALAATGLTAVADEAVDRLSGGQRQRAWLAMLLAQRSEIMLLDEPTTYLDIAHQHELLELLGRLHAEGRTIVAVLHDLNQAARYASDVLVVAGGRVVAAGRPAEVLTAQVVEEAFGVRCRVGTDPVSGTPVFFTESVPGAGG
ncbi:ABC transporter ATP-binding protein [Herbiconiux moechotypicola]|uniref:ABC transporter ATP-binding protein n=1 Tax=Herbiconiux moechotypicola TaxID=637393 RepID=A0ABP5Q2X3_9MICO|nr:ABC transporter ATP-binding protein [Herbiconiux moechotypicola]MCS5728377.1 ABC transporter ATP-binding protein [Herbiconiux moechotypicola]